MKMNDNLIEAAEQQANMLIALPVHSKMRVVLDGCNDSVQVRHVEHCNKRMLQFTYHKPGQPPHCYKFHIYE